MKYARDTLVGMMGDNAIKQEEGVAVVKGIFGGLLAKGKSNANAETPKADPEEKKDQERPKAMGMFGGFLNKPPAKMEEEKKVEEKPAGGMFGGFLKRAPDDPGKINKVMPGIQDPFKSDSENSKTKTTGEDKLLKTIEPTDDQAEEILDNTVFARNDLGDNSISESEHSVDS